MCRPLRTGETFEVEFGHIIGADGAMSAVRRLLTGRNQRLGLRWKEWFRWAGTAYLNIFPGRPDTAGTFHGEDAVAGCISYPCNAANLPGRYERAAPGSADRSARFQGGAAIPTGGDMLLEYGSRVSFVGDVAGLVEGWSGAGIEQAVISARLLSESLLNGTSYTEAMKSQTDFIARLAQASKKTLFMYRFFIMRKENRKAVCCGKDTLKLLRLFF